MLNYLHIFSDQSSSGIGALGVNGTDFLIQLVTFLIVFLVLRRYAFKPILKVLRDRQNLIESGVKLGEDMQKKDKELSEKVSSMLHDARTKADSIINSAQNDARQAVKDSEEDARTKAEGIISDANEKIRQDVSRARRNLEKDIVGLVSDATEAIIHEKIDPKKDAALIDQALRGQRQS